MKKISLPEITFSTVMVYLILTWAIIFLIDVENIFGIRDYIVEDMQLNRPFVWHYLYVEGGITEMLQWILIGFSALGAAYISGTEQTIDKKRFWLLIGILSIIMLIEDAGNPRHYFRYTFVEYFSIHPIFVTGLYYFLIGLIPIYAIFKYGYILKSNIKTVGYLIIFFSFYFIATFTSATGETGWREEYGNKIYGWIANRAPDMKYIYLHTEGWKIMDYLIEESLELVGAGALLAMVIAWLESKKEPHIGTH